MSKPIFVLFVSNNIPPEVINNYAKKLENKMPDYHVVFIATHGEPKVQVFNPSEIDPKSIEEIKEFLKQC